MYLTTAQARHLSCVIALLTDTASEPTRDEAAADRLRLRLMEPVARLLNADYVASLVWDAPTARFGRGVCCHADDAHLRAYEAEFQFSDPLAPQLHQRRYPTRVTQVMPQLDLINSEFFSRFLHPGAMYWGVNLYAHDGQRDVGDLRIWRKRSKDNFDDNELALLQLLYPSLVNALAHSGKGLSDRDDTQAMRKLNRMAKITSLHNLSPREAQVVELASQGCADKEIAQHTGVAYTTVRTYLTQALRKTGCVNRKALIAYACSV